MAQDDKQNMSAGKDNNLDDLPMRKEFKEGELPPLPPQKDINKTLGGRIANFFTFYLVGFFVNSGLSLFITYNLNPRAGVKKAKDNIANSIAKAFGGSAGKNTIDSVRSAMEISFMMISGTLITGLMTPLLRYREDIAYKINRMFGRDKDVLPHDKRQPPPPRTVEERIEQEINKRVNKHHAGLSALWLSRIGLTGAILTGDALVNRSSRILESKNLPSVDTLSWGLGRQVYKIMPKSLVNSWSNWFANHGASLGAIKTNMADHFGRLEQHGKVGNDPNSLVIAEQTRLVAKELGWTFVMANFMEKFTGAIRNGFIRRQEAKAIKEVTDAGFVPEGHRVILENGKVTLDTVDKPHELSAKRWADKEDIANRTLQRTEKADSYARAVEDSRTAGEGQQQTAAP